MFSHSKLHSASDRSDRCCRIPLFIDCKSRFQGETKQRIQNYRNKGREKERIARLAYILYKIRLYNFIWVREVRRILRVLTDTKPDNESFI